MPGYWWQCDKDSSHRVIKFESVGGFPLVKFFYNLASHDWDQSLLTAECGICSVGTMRIVYKFPRKVGEEEIAVQHIVGLHFTEPGEPLPMLWEALAAGKKESWFDFKYVSRHPESGNFQSYGLARPAIFNRSDLAKLFKTYERIVGHPLFSHT